MGLSKDDLSRRFEIDFIDHELVVSEVILRAVYAMRTLRYAVLETKLLGASRATTPYAFVLRVAFIVLSPFFPSAANPAPDPPHR